MIVGIIGDNLIHLVFGMIIIWLLTGERKSGFSRSHGIGGGLFVAYAIALIVESLELEFLTVGFTAKILAIIVGGLIAFSIRKIKERKKP